MKMSCFAKDNVNQFPKHNMIQARKTVKNVLKIFYLYLILAGKLLLLFLIKKNWYKASDISNLVDNAELNTKVVEAENKIPSIPVLVTTAFINAKSTEIKKENT